MRGRELRRVIDIGGRFGPALMFDVTRRASQAKFCAFRRGANECGEINDGHVGSGMRHHCVTQSEANGRGHKPAMKGTHAIHN